VVERENDRLLDVVLCKLEQREVLNEAILSVKL
jgi:hypothetical protein